MKNSNVEISGSLSENGYKVTIDAMTVYLFSDHSAAEEERMIEAVAEVAGGRERAVLLIDSFIIRGVRSGGGK